MNDKKKVVFINGNKSKWYEQAIFILKEEDKTMPKNLVIEAEKLINDYMRKKYPQPREKSKTKMTKRQLKFYNNVLNVAIFCTLACICYLIFKVVF